MRDSRVRLMDMLEAIERIERDLPGLKAALRALLASLGGEES